MDMSELDRRIKLGVREIRISPLFEKGKIYNLKTEKEDAEGLLQPEYNHCWVTWQSRWKDCDGNLHWSNEAYSFKTLEDAEEASAYLAQHLI